MSRASLSDQGNSNCTLPNLLVPFDLTSPPPPPKPHLHNSTSPRQHRINTARSSTQDNNSHPSALAATNLTISQPQFHIAQSSAPRSKYSEAGSWWDLCHVTAFLTLTPSDRKIIVRISAVHAIAQHGLHADIHSSSFKSPRNQPNALAITNLFWTARCRKTGRQPFRV